MLPLLAWIAVLSVGALEPATSPADPPAAAVPATASEPSTAAAPAPAWLVRPPLLKCCPLRSAPPRTYPRCSDVAQHCGSMPSAIVSAAAPGVSRCPSRALTTRAGGGVPRFGGRRRRAPTYPSVSPTSATRASSTLCLGMLEEHLCASVAAHPAEWRDGAVIAATVPAACATHHGVLPRRRNRGLSRPHCRGIHCAGRRRRRCGRLRSGLWCCSRPNH